MQNFGFFSRFEKFLYFLVFPLDIMADKGYAGEVGNLYRKGTETRLVRNQSIVPSVGSILKKIGIQDKVALDIFTGQGLSLEC